MVNIIVNSAPLISLARIGLLNILKSLYDELYIPQAVYEEIVIKGKNKPGAKEVQKANWIKILKVKNKDAVLFLRDEFGEGESEVLVLAEETKADFVLIDEKPATSKLEVLGIKRLGTLGILLLAKEKGLILKIKPYLDRLVRKGFRIDTTLYNQVLFLAKE